MDPDENLEEQLELAESILESVDEEEDPDPDDAVRLAELVVALNDWLVMSGALPRRWKRAKG